MRRRPVGVLAALASLVVVAAAAAQSFPARIDLQRGEQPEGIAAGPGNVLYVGSIPTGAVYQLNARTGQRRVLVSGRRGRSAIGLKRAGSRLFVAGGSTGRAYVYDARNGRPVASLRLSPPGQTDTFVNDVAVTSRAAYFTDSRRMEIYVVPRNLGRRARLALPDIPLQPGNNLNGIVATRDGGTLIAVQTNVGRLWRIDATTGRASRIAVRGTSLNNGDGLLLVGTRLYVVRNRLNRIAVLRLSRRLSSARHERTIRSARFDVPTTVARIGNRLYLPNARFGTDPTAETRYWVTRVSR